MKTLIFDLDGTIANTKNTAIDIIFELTQKYKYNYSKNEIKDILENKNFNEIIKDFKISKIKLAYIIWKGKKELKKRIKDIKPIKGIKVTLEKLSKNNRIILLTSNNKNNSEKFLKNNELQDLFTSKYYNASLLSKDIILKKVIKIQQLNPNLTYYIGDETRDIVASKKAGIKSISVTWGYNSKELLKKFNPNYIVEKPEEILKIIL